MPTGGIYDEFTRNPLRAYSFFVARLVTFYAYIYSHSLYPLVKEKLEKKTEKKTVMQLQL